MAKNNDVDAFEIMFGNLDRIFDEHSQTAVAKEKITDDESQKVVDEEQKLDDEETPWKSYIEKLEQLAEESKKLCDVFCDDVTEAIENQDFKKKNSICDKYFKENEKIYSQMKDVCQSIAKLLSYCN